MKTQTFLSISLAFLLNSFIIDGFESTDTTNNEVMKAVEIYQQDLESESESAIELEDWMYNDSCWKIKSEEAKVCDVEEVGNEELAIESWMTDDDLWRF